jgi:hypothetical protein
MTAIRMGLAANLNRIPGMQCSPWQLANPTPPCSHVFVGETDFSEGTSGGGFSSPPWVVQVLVSEAGGDIAGQMQLDEYLSDDTTSERSVRRAIEADPSLGGAASDLFVASCTGSRYFAFEGRPPVLGAEWRVNVIAPDP